MKKKKNFTKGKRYSDKKQKEYLSLMQEQRTWHEYDNYILQGAMPEKERKSTNGISVGYAWIDEAKNIEK